MRKYLCPITVIRLLAFLPGCDEDEPVVDSEPPKVVSTNPEEGWRVAGNAQFIVTFNRPMDSVEIAVSGVKGTTHVAGNRATWVAVSPMSPGQYRLTATGTDMHGQKLAEDVSINFVVGFCGPFFPQIVDDECKPKNGATGVDPQEYREGIILVFDKEVLEVKIISTDPEFLFTTELTHNYKVLEIKFHEFTMPNNTKFTLILEPVGLAGNKAELKYSFTTM